MEIKLENLLSDLKKFKLTENDSYIECYPQFINYFLDLEYIEEHHLVISSHFVYGWMPTIIHLDTSAKGHVLKLLNAVKCGHFLSKEELLILKNAINNSLVGLSKLLHFIDPVNYAIWDSRIFRYITNKKSQYGIDKPSNYLLYLEQLENLTKEKNFEELYTNISRNFDYPITSFRALEILMFETDRTNQLNKRNSKE